MAAQVAMLMSTWAVLGEGGRESSWGLLSYHEHLIKALPGFIANFSFKIYVEKNTLKVQISQSHKIRSRVIEMRRRK